MLLVQGRDVSVARLELLPSDQLGPLLERALNSDALAPEARAVVQQAFPDGLSPDRDWTLECPPDLARQAIFRSVDIRFENLFCPRDGEPDERPPIRESLTRENNHIHGWLGLRINGRLVPRMGFFGDHDVCMNTWLIELQAVTKLERDAANTHVFDEGEQGAPAYTFRRDGTDLLVSVDASALSSASGEETWRGEQCKFDEFCSAVQRFEATFREELERVLGPERAMSWWSAARGER